MSSCCTALLECQKLLGAEGLVVNLGCGLDEVLKVGSGEEISKIDKFAVVLVLDIDDTPSVLAPTDLLASNNDRLLRSNNSEGDNVLPHVSNRCTGFPT